MTAGFQAWTDSGFIQVDSDLGMPNWQLRQKITQATGAGQFRLYYNNANQTYYQNARMTTFNFSAVSPLCAFSCDGGQYIAPIVWRQSGNSYSVDVVASNDCNITLYVFDQADQTISGNNFGAQVFNSAGACVADATVPFARVLGVLTDNLQFGNGATGWFSGGGNEPPKGQFGQWNFGVGQVAIACVRPTYELTSNVTGVWFSMFNTSGGVVTGNNWQIGSGSSSNYVGFKEAMQWGFTAIDVSNY